MRGLVVAACVVAALQRCAAQKGSAGRDECRDPAISAVCTDAGPQTCTDPNMKKSGDWGCHCSVDDSFAVMAPTDGCRATPPPTPAPPTPAPPTPAPPTPGPPTPPPTSHPPTPAPPPTPTPPTPVPLTPGGCYIITGCEMYTHSVAGNGTGDVRACPCGQCVVGLRPSSNGTSCEALVPTPEPPPTSAPPRAFVAKCDAVRDMYDAAAFPVSYVLGVAADGGRPAVQFTVSAKEGWWGAVGMRVGGGHGSMEGLDIVGVDASGRPPTVTDCAPMTTQVGVPEVSPGAYQTTVLVEARGGVHPEYTIWRYLSPDGAQDVALEPGVTMDLAYATGPGAFGIHSHSARAVRQFQLSPCAAMPGLFPHTPQPMASRTASPSTAADPESTRSAAAAAAATSTSVPETITTDNTSSAGTTTTTTSRAASPPPPVTQAPTLQPAVVANPPAPTAAASPPPAAAEGEQGPLALVVLIVGGCLLALCCVSALVWQVRRQQQQQQQQAPLNPDAAPDEDSELVARSAIVPDAMCTFVMEGTVNTLSETPEPTRRRGLAWSSCDLALGTRSPPSASLRYGLPAMGDGAFSQSTRRWDDAFGPIGTDPRGLPVGAGIVQSPPSAQRARIHHLVPYSRGPREARR